MLGIAGHRVAAIVSGRHRSSFQSFLVLALALGCSSGAALRGSSDRDYGQIPLAFIANRGQSDHSVRFTAKGPSFAAYFLPGEVVVDLRGSSIRMRYRGANAVPDVDGLDLQQGRANFFIGNDTRKWRTDVPLYGQVIYRDLYPGIDMVYSSHKRLLKSEFVVEPGADPSRIEIEYAGVDSLRVAADGALLLTTSAGELREEAPEIYQEDGGHREPVRGAFVVRGRVVSFQVAEYDHTRPLRIDPVLSYSTYLGGNGTERVSAIAVDSAGSAYVTGYTDSSDFPVTGGVIQSLSGGSVEAFVTKLNAAGSAIVYSTYLGGDGDDRGFSIAVNSAGNAYITGYSSSTNFPMVSAFQSSSGGGRDAFVAKLNPTGTALIYSTYLGGSGTDSGNGIAIDAGGSAYITGSTASTNFPLAAAFQGAPGGALDGFVTKLNSAGSAIVYSTYLGGSLDDRGSAIAVDTSGAAYIAGNTSSTNFPIATAVQAANGGSQDAFVTKLNPSGGLSYSTYLGGSAAENVELGRSIAVDASNNAYLTGTTASTNFPVSAALQSSSRGGGNDAFVVKLATTGSTFVYSTYLGGSSMDFGESIAIDSGGSAYIGGYTASPDFPIANAGQPANAGNYDAFLAKLNPAGNVLTESGFLGGGGLDAGFGVALDPSGNAYLAGQTSSTDFPLLGAIQTSGGSTLAAFVARFSFGPAGPPTAVSATPSGSGASQTFALAYADARGFADISWVEMNWSATQATATACYLHYDRATNALQLSNDAGSGWLGSVTVGAPGTIQNSQCIVDGGASSTSASGNNLTLNLALTFKPAFGGAKNIYMRVQDAAGTLTLWQARGTWTVTAALPAATSVTPATGSGIGQTFSFVFTDPYGSADISYVNILFQATLVAPASCYLQYTLSTNTLALVADSGSGYAGSAVIGSAGVLSNSQCVVNTAGSSVSAAGNALTVNLALTFTGSFVGAKTIFMGAVNNATVFSGWQSMGVWIVPTGGILPAANVSVTPASGSGSNQTFSLIYSDPYGYADISSVNLLINTQIAPASACFVQYTRATNTLALVQDSGSGYVGTRTAGTAGSLSNTQCTLDTGASSATVSGNNLTVNLALVFKPAFSGAKNVYMGVYNGLSVFTGWDAKGVWTALASAAPTNVSVSPSSGSGAVQTFTFVYSNPNGGADINLVDILIHTQIAAPNACFVQYTRANNALSLVQDSGSGYTGSYALGFPGTLNNSQCALDAWASSVSIAGNNLTLTLAFTFKTAFNGAKNIYMGVVNNATVFSGWEAKGAWTVSSAVTPGNISVSPPFGTGTSATFSLVYSDAADINLVDVLLNNQIAASNACFVQYTQSTNKVALVQNAGSGYVGTATVGSAGTLSNTQCSVNAAASSVTVSGNELRLNLALTFFTPAFTGLKIVYMGAVNNAAVFSGWQGKGTWTVP